jgi:glutathione S-transferase
MTKQRINPIKRRVFITKIGLFGGSLFFSSFTKSKNIIIMSQPKFELISHHLCPFLHRSIIFLEKKGLKRDVDFTVTYVPIYDLPKWLFELSPKGSMPVLKFSDNKILLRSVTINAYFDETIEPAFFPTDQMRMVYTSKDAVAMTIAIDKLFAGLKDAEKDLQPIIANQGKNEAQMVECSFGALFTLMLNFDKIKKDERWANLKDVKAYADKLMADPIVLGSKCPDYNGEFEKFFNHFGSAFKLNP